MNERIEINEVSPRDGLQMEKAFVPTESKIAYIDAGQVVAPPTFTATSIAGRITAKA